MDGDLQAAMTAGLFVEYRDEQGNTIGQTVFTGWQGRPVPNIGDLVCCTVQLTATRRQRKLLGRVKQRHFEVQHEDDGRPCVWARLVLEVVASPTPKPTPKPQPRIRFSSN
ncbi:MAG TPA: hypothetical protein VNH11_32690 [Pirellulales bacterium]|nr:hypothetical protein [Pirellulales bacterium]